jgi:protoheme IX farnesyltransferase
MINYYLITKPGIVLGNLITLAAGFILGSQGAIDYPLFLYTLIGLACVMASACVFNNYIDRAVDLKMQRTRQRALASGKISSRNALLFAAILGVAGGMILYAYTNILALALAAIGFFVYVLLYSLWKCRTVYGTAIGSIAGAVPPAVGYCAASGHFDAGAAVLFAMLVLWQMPHFFAIALYHLDDYTRAKIPVLPLERGIFRTKLHMVAYILIFIPVTMLLTYFQYTGQLFLWSALILGGIWLLMGLYGFARDDNRLWGRQMFRYSLVLIGALCLIIPFDKA